MWRLLNVLESGNGWFIVWNDLRSIKQRRKLNLLEFFILDCFYVVLIVIQWFWFCLWTFMIGFEYPWLFFFSDVLQGEWLVYGPGGVTKTQGGGNHYSSLVFFESWLILFGFDCFSMFLIFLDWFLVFLIVFNFWNVFQGLMTTWNDWCMV